MKTTYSAISPLCCKEWDLEKISAYLTEVLQIRGTASGLHEQPYFQLLSLMLHSWLRQQGIEGHIHPGTTTLQGCSYRTVGWSYESNPSSCSLHWPWIKYCLHQDPARHCQSLVFTFIIITKPPAQRVIIYFWFISSRHWSPQSAKRRDMCSSNNKGSGSLWSSSRGRQVLVLFGAELKHYLLSPLIPSLAETSQFQIILLRPRNIHVVVLCFNPFIKYEKIKDIETQQKHF